jgi:hypothetical protein
MRANVDTTTLGMERCVSCDASLSGPYCSRCGERALEPEALTLRHFLATHRHPPAPARRRHVVADAAATLRAAAMLIYVLNSVFMTAVQLAGAAIALALA